MSRKLSVLLVLGLVATLLSAAVPAVAAAPQPAGEVKDLKIIWAEWDPANYLAELVKDYETAAGVKVTVVTEPWGSYYTRVSAEWAAKGTAFDMVFGDSQWLGQGASQGHYVELTDFLKENNLLDKFTPATLKYYGEFPANSARYWAVPGEGDAEGWAYRKDLFEDPKEMADFKAKYGYDLAVPKDYKEFRDIAEFFYRPTANPPLYGVALYTDKSYDAITMGVEQAMFSYGAEWQDKCNNVLGVVNSKKAIEALQMYKDLYKFGPPGNTNAFYPEMNSYFVSGQVAMTMNYFAFFPILANPKMNPYADKTGYFANPAGPYGDRYVALGGQGISINSYVAPERIDAAKAFLKWFSQDDVQAKWARLGGYTCSAKVLATPEFLKIAPFNQAFADSMQMVKDFWNIPEYGPLLAAAQTAFSSFIVADQGGTAEEVMNNLAQEHDKVLRDAGVIKEGCTAAPAATEESK
jgi:multiple sugar transport system substrate-binding protein